MEVGNKAIIFAKNLSDSTIFVEEIRNGKKRLAAKTLYKLPRTIDVSFIKNAPELYAHSDPGTIKIINVKNEIVKQQLFKEIDNTPAPVTSTKSLEDMVYNNQTKKEATESINAVIARYGQSPEFLGIYAQVGAVIASYEILPHSSEKSTSVPSTPSKFLEDMIYKDAAVTIGNQTIKCRHGLLVN